MSSTLIDQRLCGNYTVLSQEVDALNRFAKVDRTQAIKSAEQLESVIEKFRDDLCEANTEATFRELIQQQPNSLYPLVNRLSVDLSGSAVCCDSLLKTAISKALRITLELFVYQCIQQQQSVPVGDVESLRNRLQTVKHSLGQHEAELHFLVSSCEALALKLDVGRGKWREMVARNKWPMLEGLTQLISSANASPPYVSLGSVGLPGIRAARDAFRQVEKLWYAPIWYLRWTSVEKRVETLDDYQKMRRLFLCGRLHPKVRHFFCQLLFEIICSEQSRATPEVKDKAFRDDSFSILALAKPSLVKREKRNRNEKKVQIVGRTIFKSLIENCDRYWRSRFQAIIYLGQICTTEQYKRESLRVLRKKRFSTWEREAIKGRAEDILRNLSSPSDEQIATQENADAVNLNRSNIEQSIAELGNMAVGTDEFVFNSPIQAEEAGSQDNIMDTLSTYLDNLETLDAVEKGKEMV